MVRGTVMFPFLKTGTMIKWETLHKAMLAEIEECRWLSVPEKEQVESAFNTAVNFWEDIKNKLAGYKFENKSQEINFYKNIKPTFTCYIEYFTIVYLSLCYEPPGSPEVQKFFWIEELKKLQKFYHRNAAFVAYYKNGCDEQDLQYFLPDNHDLGNYVTSRIYDMDGAFMTSHDHLVAMLLAQELYHEYVKKKLEPH
ncbi:MAG: hypothetical protein JWO92_1162 [Chitinophagaceae bacterium]|nr:hypothetical protein [Chitinophagaceae bacterium]